MRYIKAATTGVLIAMLVVGLMALFGTPVQLDNFFSGVVKIFLVVTIVSLVEDFFFRKSMESDFS